MVVAATEKERLEQKQREVRQMRERLQIEHRPVFFRIWENPFDDQTYYVYNHKYFEHCRP
jgi:Oxysterol-binding protein